MCSINCKDSYLDKGLDLGSLGNLLFAHLVGDFSGVDVNTSNEGMAVRFLARSFIVVLDDDGFASGKSSTKDQHDLS